MSRPPDIIDREHEWTALEKIFARDRPELTFVLGRRRVGKSYLLTRFADSVDGIYYQGTRQSEEEQRASMAEIIASAFDDRLAAGARFATWDALFGYLTSKLGGQPLMLVLDEFPYLTQSSPGLTSVLQRFWDHEWQDTRIRLILCGSYITAMQQLEEVDQPLFGRRTSKIHFRPFTSSQTAKFVESWRPRDQFLLFGTLGNLPGNLALVDSELSLAQNAQELLLDPSGRLVDEAQHVLDAFSPGADAHYAILDAIAGGERTWSGITKRTGRSGGSLSRPLAWLEAMELLERVVPITEKNPARSKRAMYRVNDPYLSFWHSIIAPLIRKGTIGLLEPAEIWTEMVEPRLDDHMGEVFEQICREWVAEAKRPFAPAQLGSWWDAKSQNEVDVVAFSARDELFVAECKWGSVSFTDLEKLRHRAELVRDEFGNVSSLTLGLFSGRGEWDRDVRQAAESGEVELYGPRDILGQNPT